MTDITFDQILNIINDNRGDAAGIRRELKSLGASEEVIDAIDDTMYSLIGGGIEYQSIWKKDMEKILRRIPNVDNS